MQEQQNTVSSPAEQTQKDPKKFDSQPNDIEEDDLVDLQPDVIEEKTLISRILGPKLIILTFLSLIFISRNIYNLLVIKPQQEQEREKLLNTTGTAPNHKVVETDFWKDTLQLFDKLWGYIIMTVVLTAFYFLLVRLNNKEIEKKMRRDAEKQARQELEKQKQEKNSQNTMKEDRNCEEEGKLHSGLKEQEKNKTQ